MKMGILESRPGICYLCKRHAQTQKHHIYGGPKRSMSEENGFFVYLCLECHNALHGKRDDLKRFLQKECEQKWLGFEQGRTVEGFRSLVGRNYL
jgi:hypothetical protein